jgi:hypothetical protein
MNELQFKIQQLSTIHEALVLSYGSVTGAIERMPEEEEIHYAGIDHNQWFEAIATLSALQDSIRSLLITDSPCLNCGGQGGWIDNGPQEGCHEFADSQDIPCHVCDGRGWVYKDSRHSGDSPEHIAFERMGERMSAEMEAAWEERTYLRNR